MIRIVLLTVLILSVPAVYAQGELVADYRLDDCLFTDDVRGNDAFFFGGNACVCGVRANGIRFAGQNTFAEFPDAISALLNQEFSISFYVQFEPGSAAPVDLFYYGDGCRGDSLFSVRYLPNINQLRVQLSDSPTNGAQVTGVLSSRTCWQYIVITKLRSILRLYVNGELVDQNSATSDLRINLFRPANMTLSASPCQRITNGPDAPFRGKIDELRFYNYRLDDREIQGFNFKPDQIITPDTTIFLGDALVLETGGTCSDMFSWTPTTDMINANTTMPIVTPLVSTTYEFRTQNDGCQVRDQVRVNVVRREDLTCRDLLLPNVFSPNEDRINDDFGISNLFLVESLQSFEIFDKWGGRVFFTDVISGRWDGFINNSPSPPGAYVYKVTYTCQGSEYVKSGIVNLLR